MYCVEKKNKCSGESTTTTTTIDSLPDNVLRHILSFLPTEEAISTCLLSKRWKSQWLSLQSLNFNEAYHTDLDSFSDFVNCVLSSKNNSLQSLTITSTFQNVRGIQIRYLNIFLHAAWWKEIQQLNLHMTAASILLPYPFYRCKTLVTLNLYNVTLDCPIRVDFPLLKSIILNQVVFTNCANVFNFFRGCPNLEDLDSRSVTVSSSGGNHMEEEVVAKPLPKLVTAKVSYSSHIMFPLLSNAQFLKAQMDAATINYVENPMFQRLTNIDLTFASDCCNVTWNWFVKMLHNSPKLRYLTIHKVCSFCSNEVAEVGDSDLQIIPECLSSQLARFTLKCYKGLECEAQVAKYIIQNSKVLQNMTIHTTLSDLKHPMLETLYLCPKGSVTCNLRFYR